MEKELDRKTKERYSGLYIVFRQTARGSYVLMEPDGTVHRKGVAAFRLVSHISRKDLGILAEHDSGYADDNQ